MKLKIVSMLTCIIVGVLIVFISSCSERKTDDFVTVPLEEKILSDATPLKIDSVWYPADSIYSMRFYVYADTVLIVENQKAAGHFLDFYNMNNRHLIAKLLPFGEGPGELLFTQMNYDGEVMRVMDYINRKLCNIVIADVLIKDDYTPDLLPVSKNYIITSSPIAYGDSIIYVNPYHYVNHRAKIDQQPPRLIASAIKQPEPKMPMDFDYMTFNVGQGYLGGNIHLGKIFFASNESSFIEFYDANLKLIKKVLGPVILPEAKLSVSTDENNNREVCYKGMIQPEAYRGFTSSNDRLCFIYSGQEVPLNNPKDFSSYVLCFDWEGNFLNCYSIPVRIYSLSVSAYPDTFYATIMDNENNPQLVKLTNTK